MIDFSIRVSPILLIALSGFIGGCTTYEEGLDASGYSRQNTAGIQSALSGNTIVGKFVGSDDTYTLHFIANGMLRGRSVSPTGEVGNDTGRWEVTNDGFLCDNWKIWREGSDCDRLYLRGNEFVLVNEDGTKSSFGKIGRGNSRRF